MKKTLTANISGTVFHIEEDAYEALNRYLGNIRGRFVGTSGREDIMADIEARIAELFQERFDGRRQVVNLTDVDHVMAILGQPEDFADGEPESSTNTDSSGGSFTGGSTKRRFFRDSDDKRLGGVLGGLGAFIGVDPLWLRIAFVALVLASVGVLIPIYILLWILVPQTETAADRLRMRGEPVTVENIKRVVQEGADQFKQGSERFANEANDMGRRWSQHADRRKDQAVSLFKKLLGIGILIAAFSLLIGMVSGAIGGTVSLWQATWSNDDMGLLDLGALVFNSKGESMWMAIGVLVLVAVPIIGMFLGGFRLLLDTQSPKWLGRSLSILWLLALIPVITTGINLGKEFKRNNSALTEITLEQPVDSVLHLDALTPTDSAGSWSVRYNDGELDVDLDGFHVEQGKVFGAWASLDVERSADSLFHLKAERSANGATAKAALDRATGIVYTYEQRGNLLLVSPVITFDKADKIRSQDVRFTLEVPLGKSVHLRPGSKDVIYDIDNVTNVYDDDMLGRTWTMTSRGLEDLNAPNPPLVPADTIVTVHGPVAAAVWRAPSKKQPVSKTHSAKPQRSVNNAARPICTEPAPVRASLVPDVLALLAQRLI